MGLSAPSASKAGRASPLNLASLVNGPDEQGSRSLPLNLASLVKSRGLKRLLDPGLLLRIRLIRGGFLVLLAQSLLVGEQTSPSALLSLALRASCKSNSFLRALKNRSYKSYTTYSSKETARFRERLHLFDRQFMLQNALIDSQSPEINR